MARIRWLVCALALAGAAPAWGASQLPASIPRIRPIGQSAVLAYQRGIAHSPTFRDIVARLQRSDVVVYISVEPRPAGKCPGATRFVSATRYNRFLHIVLDRKLAPKTMIALLAHELQHALEVAEAPSIRDIDSFREHYEEHGFRNAQLDTFDSRAARETGRRVRAELATTAPDFTTGG